MKTPPPTDGDLYDANFIKSVFDRCSRRYIAFSYLISLGFTERWRRQCVACMPEPATDRPRGYDLMAGTGEIWPHLLRRFPDLDGIVAVDISSGMHQRAMERLHKHRAHRIEFVEDDVLKSDLPPASVDFAVSTFGLKTFNSEQQAELAQMVARSLKPGGVFAMIEASDPEGWVLRPVFNWYLKKILPLVERFMLKGAQDFATIGVYTANFGSARAFADMLAGQGLDVRFEKHFFGCATSVSGRKPLTIQQKRPGPATDPGRIRPGGA